MGRVCLEAADPLHSEMLSGFNKTFIDTVLNLNFQKTIYLDEFLELLCDIAYSKF